jgi:glycosyltransferase involved in cell wall biosynthesis
MKRLPIVITYRGSDLNQVPTADGPRAWTGRILSQIAALGAARIVCVSEGLRRQLWWRQEIATVLPSGVDLSRFHPGSKLEARERLGWSAHPPVVLFNAGHDPLNKRLDLAQRSLALLRERVPAVNLKLMRGDVSPDQVPDWMNASDCLLLTSDAEGSPTVIQEALACALPIVSVDAGDAVERLSGVDGTRVCNRDPLALAEAMQAMIVPPRRSQGAIRAAEVDSTRIARQLCSLYRTCIDDSHARGPHRTAPAQPLGR